MNIVLLFSQFFLSKILTVVNLDVFCYKSLKNQLNWISTISLYSYYMLITVLNNIRKSIVHILFSMVGFSNLLVKAYTDKTLIRLNIIYWECSGSVIECLTRDRRAAGSILTGVTALCP